MRLYYRNWTVGVYTWRLEYKVGGGKIGHFGREQLRSRAVTLILGLVGHSISWHDI